MVGEVCDREISSSKYGFETGNSSTNSSFKNNLGVSEADFKLKIAVSLTLLVGVIQVRMKLISTAGRSCMI